MNAALDLVVVRSYPSKIVRIAVLVLLDLVTYISFDTLYTVR